MRQEAGQFRHLAASVLLVDLEQARDEEVLLFRRWGMPVVGLAQSHGKAKVAGPLAFDVLSFLFWRNTGIYVNSTQVVEGPSLANREGARRVFSCFVDAHPTRPADGDEDQSALLVVGRRIGGRRRRRIHGVFCDSDMGDIRLKKD